MNTAFTNNAIRLSPAQIPSAAKSVARAATLAAVKANADPSTFWYLNGFVVTPYIRGVPDARLSFKVPPKLRMHLASAGRYVPPPT